MFCTLLTPFGLNVPPDSLCGHSDETLEHFFFHCPLVQSGLDWIQPLLFLSSPPAPAITVRHVLFGFSSDELLCVPRVFCYLLSLLKCFVWCQRNDYCFRSKPPSAVGLIASIKGRLSFYLPLLLNVFGLGAGAVFSNDNGELMAVSVRSLVPLFISVFLSVVRVCLPRSPLLAVLWSSWLFFFLLEYVCLPSLCSPSVAFVGCTAVILGSELALLECAFPSSRCSPRPPLLVALWFLFLR